jgi:prepilin-type N-terminal cleavage/methylation domain-containing protein
MGKYQNQQPGFTLVEIAIVLVIIGLLLAGILKGQELIASAKVKNLIGDFRGISAMVYGYQDKFRSFPGDQTQAQLDASFGAGKATAAAAGANNGRLDGDWNTSTKTDETWLFWQHVRLANLASGPTNATDPNGDYVPKNADGGRIGIESGLNGTGTPTPFIAGMTGAFFVCSDNIQGRYAKQMDTTLDDGNAATGSVRIVKTGSARGSNSEVTSNIVDGGLYIVCQSF